MGKLPFPVNDPSDAPLYITQFNAEWLPLLIGALDAYRFPDFYDEPSPEIGLVFDELVELLQTEYTPVPQVFQKEAYIPGALFIAQSGDTPTFAVDAAQITAGYWQQANFANANEFQCEAVLDAGTYTVSIVGQKTAASGKVDVYADGVLLGAIDLYNASTLRNVRLTVSLTVSAARRVTFHLLTNGKNASSSGFRVFVSYIDVK